MSAKQATLLRQRPGSPPPPSVFSRFLRVAVLASVAYLGIYILTHQAFDLANGGHGGHGDRTGCRWYEGRFRGAGPDCGRPWRRLGDAAGDHREPTGKESLRRVLMETPSADKAQEWSRYYSSGPHLAGQNYSQAEWTLRKWEEWGISSTIVPYHCWLNYPADHALSLLSASGPDSWNVEFHASLEEDALPEDPTSTHPDRIPTFHGYAASGNVTAPFVWVNYGTYQDFEDLVRANVSLAGKIAIARYGLVFRGLKVKRAQELGMVAVVMYSDPGDDGEITEAHGYDTYPQGPARNPSAVQRGSVVYMSILSGDPTTPGYPSKPGAPRQDPGPFVPSIPSLPISYRDAVPILRALNGHGPRAADVGPARWWTRMLGLGYLGVDYHVGPSPDDLVLNLYTAHEYTTTPVWDVIGIVNGTGPAADEVVVVGCHRDAWIVGGAADPGSGSSALNEVVRSFGAALATGWRPSRTIVFASWDGEEYGLLGSAEWVEEHLPWLSGAAVAYVNTDVAAEGPIMSVVGAPLLHRLANEALALVPSPGWKEAEADTRGSGGAGAGRRSVWDDWGKRIHPPGTGSDYASFMHYAGIPVVHVGFMEDKFPTNYHSNYDSLTWMSRYGDQNFSHHVATAQVLNLITAELASSAVIPFNSLDYANELDGYLDQIYRKLGQTAASKLARSVGSSSPKATDLGVRDDDDDDDNYDDIAAVAELRSSRGRSGGASGASSGSEGETLLRQHLDLIRDAIASLHAEADKFDQKARQIEDQLRAVSSPWRFWTRLWLRHRVRHVNRVYRLLERGFLYEKGLDGRELFRHVVFAPGLWSGYSGVVFPGLSESIEVGDYENGVRWAKIILERVKSTTARLGGC